jgi:aspartyl protease family protein
MMRFFIAAFMFVFVPCCFAVDVEVKMLAKGSAVLLIDGNQRMLREGARSPEGVVLVSADGKQAVIEIDGKQRTMQISHGISRQFKAADKTEIRIASSEGGHYRAKGLINGTPVDFFVDTGATFVSMNYHEAERLGIDYRGGIPSSTTTANGRADTFIVTLNNVSVGNIVLNQVLASVHLTDFPQEILLGNSYLGRVDISIDNGVLILKEKYASGQQSKGSEMITSGVTKPKK